MLKTTFRTTAMVFLGLSSGLVQALQPGPGHHGIEFKCTGQGTNGLAAVAQEFSRLGIEASWLEGVGQGASLRVGLKHELAGPDTLGIASNPFFSVTADVVQLLDPRRQVKLVPTVSKKEIALALLHPGRLTTYKGPDCGLAQFKDDLGVRQNIVAWAQTLAFDWPEGTPATWNSAYWHKGTPLKGVSIHEALTDMVINSGDYSIGCYTAAKAVLSAAVLDYYKRVKGNEAQAAQVEAALMADGEPLVNIEPGLAWSFEKDFDPADKAIKGKIIELHHDVAPKNFVPGDWIYLLNPDPVSYEKTGYEGSNAIYLGLNRFSDYYNDHQHSFNFQQKTHEVYQWRHGVFSRTRDSHKVEHLTQAQYDALTLTPEQGGLLLAYRMVPRQLQSVGAP